MKTNNKNEVIDKIKQSLAEEVVNSITHGLGALLSMVGLIFMLIHTAGKNDPLMIVSIIIYSATLIFMYLSSTLYHSFQNEKVKRIFHIFDHAAIFLLIAGTYTPMALIFLRQHWGWTVFIIIWSMALLGASFKIFFMGKLKKMSLVFYLSMGWFAVFSIKAIFETLPKELIFWIFGGGFLYTVGLIFYGWKKLPFHHSIWHLFVLGGSTAHFIGIFRHLSIA